MIGFGTKNIGFRTNLDPFTIRTKDYEAGTSELPKVMLPNILLKSKLHTVLMLRT